MYLGTIDFLQKICCCKNLPCQPWVAVLDNRAIWPLFGHFSSNSSPIFCTRSSGRLSPTKNCVVPYNNKTQHTLSPLPLSTAATIITFFGRFSQEFIWFCNLIRTANQAKHDSAVQKHFLYVWSECWSTRTKEGRTSQDCDCRWRIRYIALRSVLFVCVHMRVRACACWCVCSAFHKLLTALAFLRWHRSGSTAEKRQTANTRRKRHCYCRTKEGAFLPTTVVCDVRRSVHEDS